MPMKKPGSKPRKDTLLRKRAEKRLQGVEKKISDLSPDKVQKLIYELQVHQIELEMQNEELVAAQAEIEESRNRYADLYDFAPIGYFTFDSNGVITEVNLAGAVLMGMSRSRLIGVPFTVFIVKEDQDIFYLHRKKVIEGKARQICDLRLKRKDGTEFHAHLESISVVKSAGETGLCRTAVTDITVQKLAAERLSLLNEAIAILPVGITITDKNGRIVYANAAEADMHGYSVAELLGKESGILGPSALRSRFALEELQKIGVWRRRSVNVRKNGEEFPVRLTSIVVRDSKNLPVGIVTSCENVTDIRKAEEALLRTRNLESLSTFAGGLAHDFNNLLAAVLGYVELARMNLDPEDKISKMLAESVVALLKARDLAMLLITFSKGGMPLRKKVFITDLLVNAVNRSLAGSEVKCRFALAEDLGAVEADEDQIAQVINNLIMNSREAMPHGGGIDVAAVNMVISKNNDMNVKEGKYIKISISDQGEGIPEEHLDRIFDPYFTTKEMGSQKGMGLGLAICYSIIRNHDGAITVTSKIGEGTTFDLYIPATAN